ncbi:MAG: rRNA maturation RNase YbeY [Thermomicrobiaceae bacterium]
MTPSDRQALRVDFTVTVDSAIPDPDRVELLLSFAADQLQLSGEIGIWLCNDDEIADLHWRFMNISGATDVITFASDDATHGGYLGDIAVSVDTAVVQADEAGHSLEREVAYLCLHGLLHLAGYDDLDAEARRQMIERQEDLLSEFEHQHPGKW